MTKLFPRLPPGPAMRLFDDLRKLPLSEIQSHRTASHPATVYTPIGGERVTQAALDELRSALLQHARESDFPNAPSIAGKNRFDIGVARYLHSHTGLTPAEAGSRDGGVWAHLALVTAPDIAFWRFSGPPGDRILGTDLTRHVFGRMWWRAHLVFDATGRGGDPYEALAVLGEAGLDQIAARRRTFGRSPYLVRAILRVWRDFDRCGLGEQDLLRDFLKRLLRLAPFIAFEALTNEQLDAELLSVAIEARKALIDAR
jgi:hypothetical protein